MTTPTNTPPTPVAPAKRMVILDVIRGFALLGILLMNIEFFQRALQSLMLGFNSDQSGLDYAVAWFSFSFIQGKFYTMFSLLFGLGFIVFIDRAMQRGVAAKWLFSRRLLVLLCFGMAHLIFIWGGDILHLYAAVGFLLLLFTQSSVKRLWRWGLVLFAVPVVFMWLGAFAIQAALQAPDGGAQMLAGFADDQAKLLKDIAKGELIYASAGYWDVVQWRIYEWRSLYLDGGILFFVPMILGMFLIGAAFGRAGVFADTKAHSVLFARMMVFGYGVGIPAALVWGVYGTEVNMLYPTVRTAALVTCSHVASLALCLAYIGTLVTLYDRGAVWLHRLAPAGRMALTNYLMQSVVFTLLFYGYGLGFYGEFGRAAVTLLALLLYGFQLWFSHWWLQRFRAGPLEWLWRSLTYGQRQPLTR